MFQKTVAVALIAAMTCLSSIAQAQSEPGGQTQGPPDKAAAMKAKIQKIGVGEKSVVHVKLKDGTELRGHLSQIERDSFTVTDRTTKKATSASYGDVRSVSRKGIPTAGKVVIVVVVVAAITVGAILAYALTHLKI